MENKEKEAFSYTYSAKERDEIAAIRKKYIAPEEEDAMTRLRRLDAGVTQKASVVSLVLGVIGALVLGFGMSLSMSDFGKILGEYASLSMPLGIVVGLLGLGLACMALPVYNLALKKGRKKAAPEIIRLSEELLK